MLAKAMLLFDYGSIDWEIGGSQKQTQLGDYDILAIVNCRLERERTDHDDIIVHAHQENWVRLDCTERIRTNG